MGKQQKTIANSPGKLILQLVSLSAAVFFFSSLPFSGQENPGQESAREKVDWLISGGTVVAMDAGRRVLPNGAVAVRGDTIVAVGPTTELEAKYHAARRIDAREKLVLPGLINGHTHAAMTLLRGLADDLALQEWLEKYIFPAEARNVSPEFVRVGTKLGIAEMLRSGITTYVDMYYFEDDVARVTKTAGMRGVLGETIIDFPAPDNKTIAQALSYTEEFLKHWKGDALIQAAVAPHSAYLCSEKTLRDSAALARRYGAPIVTHVSETRRENDEIRSKHNATPVAYLDSLQILGPDVVAAHCVWVDSADMAILARHNVGCVHNPASNMKLASGIAPVTQMLAVGVAVGLGTDGAASNNTLDLIRDLDLAAKLQKVGQNDPRALPAQQALELATITGARAIHRDSEIGSLEAGKKADIILLRTRVPHSVPLYNVYSQIVYALKAEDVETVFVAGRPLMENHRLLTLDEPKILADAQKIQKTLQK
jgi:5-methylthioadenosine/S-adenosylhomocysteine deaminase